MKKTILPALAMLVIATVMLSTASFAWFAISSKATANGMSVSVKSDSAFLVISNENSIASDYQTYEINVTDTAQKKLAPTAFDPSGMPSAAADYTTLVNTEFTTSDTTSDVWYTMSGTADDNGTGKVGTEAFISNNDFGEYVAKYTVYVAVAPMTGYTMYNLQANVTLPETGDLSVSVLVVGSNGYMHFTNGDTGNNRVLDATTVGSLASTVTATPIQMDIYVYYNGNHSQITTNNYFDSKILDTVVSVNFTASSVATP